jgi:hypothetical protein
MKLNWKAFLIALPIAVFIQAISIFMGISVYGESFIINDDDDLFIFPTDTLTL